MKECVGDHRHQGLRVYPHRVVQEDGEVSRGKRGRSGAGVTPRDAATTIVAVASSFIGDEVIKGVRDFSAMLMQLAIELGMRNDDPTLGIKTIKIRSDGFQIWGPEHIEKFRNRHAIGTKARLALELLLNTAQRRSDVVRMGRQHVRDGILSIRQQKTGTLVEIPILPELQEALDAMPADHLTYLTTEYGQAFSAAGFGNWFRERCNEADLPKGYASHGLRKAAATRLADAGCTDHEIMAWGGWETLKEVQRYTKAANRKRLAQSGRVKLETRTSSGKPE